MQFIVKRAVRGEQFKHKYRGSEHSGKNARCDQPFVD